MKHSIYDPNTKLYRFYFKIARFIRYDGAYIGRYHTYQSYICNYDNTSYADPPPDLRNDFVPTKGTLKVYSKSPLATSHTHLVAGSLHQLHGKRRLVMCCVDEDEVFAENVLRDAIFRQSCEC